MLDPITRLNAALEGRYRIERQLGEGGMATVYLADDLRHERKVALKVLKPELAAVVGADRFLAEIKTTANLQHPHILPLFDSGEADSFLFYVMPFVDGESLRERLDREHQLPVDEAVAIAKNVAEALDYAHRQGVIHRDIKPANILLQDGKPVVSDFGIALAVSAGGAGRLTETGLSLGTPHYMSPEQATGDVSVGAATDIYAVGCVLYEMLVGSPPFVGGTPQAVLGKIVTGEVPSARAERKSVPRNVDAAIRRALEKVPADRFGGGQDFARALADGAFRHGDLTLAVGGTSPRGRRWVASGLAVVLGMAGGVLLSKTLMEPEGMVRSLARFGLPAPDGEVYAFGRCCGPQLTLSPDGEWVAFVTQDGAIYRRRIGDLEAERVGEIGSVGTIFFSPDSRSLGFYRGGRLLRVPMSGGPIVQIGDLPTPTPAGVSWGDDDVIVVVPQGEGGIFLLPGSGGDPVTAPNPSGDLYWYPWVLPGGGAVLLTTRDPPGESRMIVLDLKTGDADTLGLATRVAYADGHLLFSTPDGTLLAQPFDPVARQIMGQAQPIIDDLFATGGAARGEFAPATSGSLVYISGSGGSQPLVVDGANGQTELTRGAIWDPAFSPDGSRVAFRNDALGEAQDIWLFDRDQGFAERFTIEGRRNMIPVWAPNGSRIAYMSHRLDRPGQIYWQPVGGGPAERLLDTEFQEWPGSWSPDGETLAFSASRDGDRDIGLFTVGDSAPRWVLADEFTEMQPQISPDGRWLAYTSDLSGELQVYVQALSSGGELGSRRIQVSSDGGHSPRWDPDGGVLYYAANAGGPSATIVRMRFTTEGGFRPSTRDSLFTAHNLIPGASTNYDVRADGSEFTFIGNNESDGQLVWVLNWTELLRGAASGQ